MAFLIKRIGASLVLGALLLAAGCGSVSRPNVAIDCAVPGEIELSKPFRDFETDSLGGTATWFGSGDPTGASHPPPITITSCDGGVSEAGIDQATTKPTESVTVQAIEGAGRCGSKQALVLRSEGHNDWGSLFGDYGLVNAPDIGVGTGYDGVALWARSPTDGRTGHDKAVTLLLDDSTTTVEGGKCNCVPPDPLNIVVRDENGNILTQGRVSPAGSCGNQFRRALLTAEQWRLYLLPFESFVQDRVPNASPNGFDRSKIYRIVIRAEKEARLELWLDDIGFYRKK